MNLMKEEGQRVLRLTNKRESALLPKRHDAPCSPVFPDVFYTHGVSQNVRHQKSSWIREPGQVLGRVPVGCPAPLSHNG